MPREAAKHTHNGKTLTIDEWLREPEAKGLTKSALKSRIHGKGLSLSEALAMPRGRAQAKVTAPAGKPKRTARKRGDATLDEHIAKRAKREPAIGQVPLVAIGSCEHAALVLTRLGYVVEDVGVVPSGRLLVVREQASVVS